MARTKTEQMEAIQHLRKVLKPGATVYTVLRSVSRSGMSRHIDVFSIRRNRPYFLTGYAAKALGYRHDYRTGGLVVGGCGMDMGFEVVYNLGRTLWPKGFIPAKAGKYGRNGASDTDRDNDGGYALDHRWL